MAGVFPMDPDVLREKGIQLLSFKVPVRLYDMGSTELEAMVSVIRRDAANAAENALRKAVEGGSDGR